MTWLSPFTPARRKRGRKAAIRSLPRALAEEGRRIAAARSPGRALAGGRPAAELATQPGPRRPPLARSGAFGDAQHGGDLGDRQPGEAAQLDHPRLLLVEVALRRQIDPGAAVTAAVGHNIGQVLLDRGEPAAARSWFEQALAVRERRQRPRDPDLALTRVTLGQTLCELGETRRGETLVRSGIAVQEEVLSADSRWRINLSGLRLARCAALAGRPDEAAALGRENLPVMLARLGPEHPLIARLGRRPVAH